MRSLVAVVLAVALFASPVFSQGAGEEIVGRVDSIDSIDPERGVTSGGIIVIDDTGRTVSCIINTATVVTDESSKKITSDDIEDGDRVKVSYVGSDSGNIALSISRMKK